MSADGCQIRKVVLNLTTGEITTEPCGATPAKQEGRWRRCHADSIDRIEELFAALAERRPRR